MGSRECEQAFSTSSFHSLFSSIIHFESGRKKKKKERKKENRREKYKYENDRFVEEEDQLNCNALHQSTDTV